MDVQMTQAPSPNLKLIRDALRDKSSRVDQATQECFLGYVEQYPYAFGLPENRLTFQEAFTAFRKSVKFTNTAIQEDVEAMITTTNMKVAKQSFLLLQSLYPHDIKKIPEIHLKTFTVGLPITVQKLGSQHGNDCFLSQSALSHLVLKGEGFFSAPSLLPKISPHLVTLDLSKLWISQLTPSISDFQRLTELSLKDNYLRKLPDAIGSLTTLRRLNISRNQMLTALPSTIGACTRLEKLSASHTKITRLPDSMAGLAQLKTLKLKHTKFNPNENSGVYSALVLSGTKILVDFTSDMATSSSSREPEPIVYGAAPHSAIFQTRRESEILQERLRTACLPKALEAEELRFKRM